MRASPYVYHGSVALCWMAVGTLCAVVRFRHHPVLDRKGEFLCLFWSTTGCVRHRWGRWHYIGHHGGFDTSGYLYERRCRSCSATQSELRSSSSENRHRSRRSRRRR